MKKYVAFLIAIGLLLVSLPAFSQTKDEKLKLINQSTALEVQMIRDEPIDVPGYLKRRIDVGSELLAKFITTGSPIVLMEDSTHGWTGIDFTFKNSEKSKFSIGYIFDWKGGGIYAGIRLKQILSKYNVPIVNQLEPGIVWYKDGVYFTIAFNWKKD